MSTVSTEINKKKYILALDAGGTMTDTVLVQEDGSFKVGKSLTNRKDEPKSYLESVDDAAKVIGKNSSEIHENTSVAIYAGTGMLNTLLTGSGSEAGLIVTKGFEDIAIIEGGLSYLGQPQQDMLHNQLHEHTQPLMDRKNVYGVLERVCGGTPYMDKHVAAGEILIPLYEPHVIEATNKLLDSGVEVIGILFINCYINPIHEQRAKEIAEKVITERGVDVPVVLSYDTAPVMKENNRLKSLLLQCTSAEHARRSLLSVEQAAKKDGYDGQLLTLLSYGGAVNISYPRLYETVISGPIGGMMGGQILSKKLDLDKVLCCDMGGTSFDVGLILDQQIPIRKDPEFAKHRLALPMVALDSVGSGAGSDVWLDKYDRLHVGPGSAGSDVGICFRYDKLTVTDVNVAMGYVDPEYFLGGKVTLDRDKAYKALEEGIAKPLGISVYEAGKGILEVVNTQMKEAAATMILAKGYNPAEFTVLVYGGAGPVHMWGFTEGLDVADIITIPYAAAFSAFGAACAEYMHRYHKGFVTAIPLDETEKRKQAIGNQITECFDELEAKARQELADEGADISQISFTYGMYARYIGQLESFDTALDIKNSGDAKDVDYLIESFENMYTKIYPEGARFPDGGYAITELYIKAVIPKAMPVLKKHTLCDAKPNKSAYVHSRQVNHKGEFHDFKVWQMSELKAGNVIYGPSIIRDPMTTLVIPPEKRIEIDEYMVLHYR